MEHLGQFGDMFGFLNALFSGIAMCGAVYAVILQTKQIQDQERQILDQKRHDEEMLRRVKLEALILELETLRNFLVDSMFIIAAQKNQSNMMNLVQELNRQSFKWVMLVRAIFSMFGKTNISSGYSGHC